MVALVRSFIVLAIAACSSASSADPPEAAPEPVVRAPAPPPIPLISLDERDHRAAAIAKTFRAADHAIVHLDITGMIDRVELTRSMPKEDAAAALLQLVRDHARDFGVANPDKLHVITQNNDLYVGEGARWTGAIRMTSWDNHVMIGGHLWPVTTPAPPAVDVERVLAPFLGLDGTEPSKCLCGHDTVGVTTRREMFEVRTGVAFVCDHGALRPHEAIAISLTANAHVPALAKLPTLFDARTGEPIAADYLMPSAGSLEQPPSTISELTDRRHDCLKW